MAHSFSKSEVQTYCAARLPQLQGTGSERRCPCPLHKGRRDSFAINIENGLWTCHACGRSGDLIQFERESTGADFRAALAEICRIVGRDPSNAGTGRGSGPLVVAEYDYPDENGELLFQTLRYDPKGFKQRRPDGSGGWKWNTKGVRLVLYRLPELFKRQTETVFICEGEQDVHAVEGLGLLATCNPMGAGKWRDDYAEMLRGRRIVIIADNDPPTDEAGRPHYKGQKHAAAVAESLLRHGCDVRIIEPPRGKDATDWFVAGGTADELNAIVAAQAALVTGTLATWTARWSPPDIRNGVTPEEWPEPVSLQSELPPVQAFSLDLLPIAFRPFVRDVADRMQVPMDYPAIVVLLCLAGVVSRRATIQPKANDSSWTVVPNLWGGIIAPPGYLKSPVIQATTRPLNQIQETWRREHDEALQCYSEAQEEFELRLSAWKEQL